MDVLRRFPEVRSIHWAINDTPAEQTNLPTKLLWGADAIEEEILGLRFRVRPSAFLQTNTEMAERLYELAREYAGLDGGGERVRPLLRHRDDRARARRERAGAVWGLEISEEAVACAIENAELNGIENARFFAGNVGQTVEELREEAGSPDVVVVDPPRAGLAGKALRRTGALGAARIVYVSCNPTTLASDLQVLRDEYGYVLERCRPVDMFPHTPHVESVSSLSRLGRARPRAANVAPEEVGVRHEEAEADRGKRGQPGDAVQAQTRTSVAARTRAHPEPGRGDAEPKRSAAARNSEKNTMSGGPTLTVDVAFRSSGTRRRPARRSPASPRRRTRRTGRDRPDVHPRDEHRDEGDPPELLEEREEAEAHERVAAELGDVGGRVRAQEREPDREGSGAEAASDEQAAMRVRASGSASQIAARKPGGRARLERDVEPERKSGEVAARPRQ